MEERFFFLIKMPRMFTMSINKKYMSNQKPKVKPRTDCSFVFLVGKNARAVEVDF